MTDFTSYPADDRYWFIRHIDGFSKPHLGTTSTAVRCELAPIPADWTEDPSELSRSKVAHLFGKRNPETIITTVLVGTIPSMLVGLVFKQGRFVGSLPAVDLDLNGALRHAEASDLYGFDPIFGTHRPVHAWSQVGLTTKRRPVMLLTEEQLHLSHDGRKHSEFLAIRDTSDPDPGNHVEFVIPRLVIYRTFYGFTTKLANLFTQGQWSDVDGEAVHKEEFAGNKTGVHLESGAWHIVLALGMSKNDAHQTALLYFDDYAKAQANGLSNPMIQAMEREQLHGAADAQWHTNARIPYDPARGPYTGTVSGYFLDPRRDGSFKGRVFLVRAIHSMNFPNGLPAIGSILVNSNEAGAEQTEVDAPRRWPSKPKTQKRRSSMPNVDTHDASTRKPAFKLPAVNFAIIPEPEVFDLVKDASTTRIGKRKRNNEQATTEGSSGNKNGRGGSLSPHEAELEQRAPYPLFKALVGAMDALQKDGHIDRWSLIQPSTHEERVLVDAQECWNFLTGDQHRALELHDEGQPEEPNWPTRCWPYVAPGTNPYSALERAALVLRVDLVDGRTAIWFEIETRSSEHYTSPLVIHTSGDLRKRVKDGLRIIRKAEGASLAKHFAAEKMHCYCHPHYMEEYEEEVACNQSMESKESVELSKIASDGLCSQGPSQATGGECAQGTDTKRVKKKRWSPGPLTALFKRIGSEDQATGT